MGSGESGTDVALFCMPWLEPRQAPLGVSIVLSKLNSAMIGAELNHVNIEFYRWFTDKRGSRATEWAFGHAELGEIAAGILWRELLGDTSSPRGLFGALRRHSTSPEAFWSLVADLRSFTEQSISQRDWSNIRIAGFTLTIHQTMMSLLWASAIKQANPDIITVLGGSQCEDPMGIALLEAAENVDVVVRGESDGSITPLFSALLNGERLDQIPRVAWRQDGHIRQTSSSDPRIEDSSPPDYRTFAIQYESILNATGVPANYYLEGSRGCWWGERNQCKFCGIHTSAIQFRQKSTVQVIAEVEDLLRSQPVTRIAFADTIMAREHISDLLPQLEALGNEIDFEYLTDVKNSLDKSEIYALARSGCSVAQIGIESFSTRLLRLMDKGNNALQHIRAIKWFTEAGITPYYHILTHVVGETPSEYEESIYYANLIGHLPPPTGVFPIELNRYSPYFEQWEELGFDAPRPAADYELMFGSMPIDLERFAYRFQGVHPSTISKELDGARSNLTALIEGQWKQNYYQNSLYYRVAPGRVEIERSSPESRTRSSLTGPISRLFMLCDDISRPSELHAKLKDELSVSQIDMFLNRLVDDGLIVRQYEGESFLALAVRKLSLKPRIDYRKEYLEDPLDNTTTQSIRLATKY